VKHELLLVEGDRVMFVVSEKQGILREENRASMLNGRMLREKLVWKNKGGGHDKSLERFDEGARRVCDS
jgi:hypothetical protein